jgi:predicted MFS family arabinose efflux permease
MSSAPRPTSATTVGILRREPRYLRAVVALGLFSTAEHAAWVTFLVVAYERGGVGEAGIVSAMLLAPAALVAPLVAKEISSLRLRHPLAIGYGVQCVALVITACVVAAQSDPVLFYMAAVLVTVTTVFSRPAHHGAIVAADHQTTLAANVATGFGSGLAQLLGPLLASVVLLRLGVVEVFVIGAVLLAVATGLTVGIDMPSPLVDDPIATPAAWPPHRPAVREVLLRVPSRDAVRSVVMLFCLLGVTTVVLGVVETLATEVGYGALGRGGAGTGALIAAAGGGLLIGASVAGITLRRVSERATMRIGAALTGVALLLCALHVSLVWSLIAFALAGTGMQMILVSGWVLLHHHVLPADTCLVFGLLESQQLVGNAVGAATAGVAIAHFGVWAVAAAASALLAAAMLLMTAPRMHRLSMAAPVAAQR